MDALKLFTEERPWGKFEQFTHNEISTIKIITVKTGEAFSLQSHKNRREFWKILSGSPEVTIGDSVVTASKGDEFNVPPMTKHRVRSVGVDTEILEIVLGIFDENDITRLEDKYGRV
ncbi:MAG: phosphomannose isomerase type II C-terminal cupin domain [Patescibacteria group bacterium]